jgi:hypothetical protein
MFRTELRGTKCYVALGVARRGRLFLLGSHSAKDARAHSLRVALVTIERVCARAKELRIDRRSALVRASEVR